MKKTSRIFLSYSKIAGVAHENVDGTSRQKIIKKCKKGETLQFIREPENQYDKNAITIYRNKDKLGYVTSNFSETLAPLMDNGSEIFAEISEITGGGRKELGCNTRVFAKSLVSMIVPSNSSEVDIQILKDEAIPNLVNIYSKLGVLDKDVTKFIYNEDNDGLKLQVEVSEPDKEKKYKIKISC